MAAREILVRIRAEIGNFRSDMQAAAQSTTALGTATAGASRTVVGAMTQSQAAAAATRQSLFDAGKAAQESAQGFGLSYNATGRLTDQFGNMVTAAHAAELGLDTASDATAEYAAQTATAAAQTAAAAQAAANASQSGMMRLVNHARANEQAWNQAGNSLALFGGSVIAGVGLAIGKFAEFDKAMSEVKASTHETSGNMDLLREAAISAGADTAFSAKEAAQGIDELAKAGVSTKDVLGGGLTGALSLAAAGSLGVGEAAEIAASALTQFKLEGSDIPHLADLLAAGAGKAQGSVQDLGGALNQAGLVASSAGLSIEETTGGLAAFASAGLTGSDAGTSFKSMLQRLTPQSKEAEEQMAALGLSAYDANGEFIGLAAFSGQLQNSMKDLDSESRNAAMGVIFGSDAVRAANVLYEQGATGIQSWIDAVNETGYAAQTAALKQDNLMGDIEKLGGSFDTVLIKGGEGAAQSLRGLVQQAESLVDMMGKIPAPVLNTGMAMAATVGGVALLAGGFLKLVPALANTVTNFRGVFAQGSRIPGVMGNIGKGVGVATAALLAFEIFNAIAYKKRIVSMEELTNAILGVANAADGSVASLDGLFNDFGTFAGDKIAADLNGVGDAIARITNMGGSDGLNRWADQAFGWTGFAKSETSQVDDRLKELGDSMGALAKNGGAEAAAKTFNALTAEFEKNGQGAADALAKMPGYEEALLGIGNSAGLSLQPFEVLELAAGKIPARLAQVQASQEASAKSTEEAATLTAKYSEELEAVGVSAQGAITNLDTFTQSLVAAGLLTLSSREAARGYKDTMDSFTETLAKNGANLDINTVAGRENEAAIDAIAKAGIASAEAIAKDTNAFADNTAQQAAVQAALKGTYTDMVNSYTAMGVSTQEAERLTRATLGIPDNANIDSWMSDAARLKADETKAAINSIPNHKTVTIYGNVDPSFRAAAQEAFNLGNIKTAPGVNINTEVSGVGGGFTGGMVGQLIAGFAGGGMVPGRIPINSHGDNILATVNGKPFGLRSGEMIINEPMTRKHMPLLKAINDGTYQAPSKSVAGGYGGGMSRSATFSASGSGGFDSAALDRLTEAVRSARGITIKDASHPAATLLMLKQELGV